MRAELENFWYHYKIPILIVAVVLAAGGYLLFQQLSIPAADYEIAVVSPSYYTDEQLAALQDVVAAAGTDVTGDGKIVVNIHYYRLEIGADGQDSTVIGSLDADLVGNRSGLFLLEDPRAFEEATNGLLKGSEAVSGADIRAFSGQPWSGLSAAVRENADEKYAAVLAALTA